MALNDRSTATISLNPGDWRTLTSKQMAPGLRMTVWPVPDEAYVLDYTYHYRHPEADRDHVDS